MEEKLELIKSLNTDDSSFILNVYEAFEKNKKLIQEKKKNTKIILRKNLKEDVPIIDLDKIDASKYLYTTMRKRLEAIMNQVKKLDKEEITKEGYTTKVIYEGEIKEVNQSGTDLVEIMKKLPKQKAVFVADKINEESLFKEEQINYALEVLKEKNIEGRYKKIYDIVYEYLMRDFISNNYCDFKNDRCIAQRNKQKYPKQKKDGCCFNGITRCVKLKKNGECSVRCMACRIFSCPYLTKMGVGYWAYEIPLFQAFLTGRQKSYMVARFFKTEETILKKLNSYAKHHKISREQ